MKQDDFDQLATAIDALSPNQRHQLLERLLHPETIPAIVAHLEQHLQSPNAVTTRFIAGAPSRGYSATAAVAAIKRLRP